MPFTATNNDLEPHIAAIRLATDSGFEFQHERIPDHHGLLTAIHAERRRSGMVDRLTLHGPTECSAGRWRVQDFPGGEPVWSRTGDVADVVIELLTLKRGSTLPDPVARGAYAQWLPTTAP